MQPVGARYDDVHISIALANSGEVQLEMAHMTEARRRIFDAIRKAAIGWDGSDPIRRSWPT